MVDQKFLEWKEVFQKIDMSNSFEAIISSLWYGTLACTGVEGISGVTRCQFHQSFMRPFFVQNFGAKNYKAVFL